jgi:DNA-binding transcriptional LysR family regulator
VLQLKDLEYFVAVYESGGFGRAANALNTAQSHVSLRIRRLEEAIGGVLFERMHRGIRPTKRGDLLYRHARHVLRVINELHSAMKEQDAA